VKGGYNPSIRLTQNIAHALNATIDGIFLFDGG
jgi:DNA-binding XRE family transcriptional regulator